MENATVILQTDVKELAEKNLEIPQKKVTKNSITEAEFNKMMTAGLAQAKVDDSLTVEETLSNLRREIAKGVIQ